MRELVALFEACVKVTVELAVADISTLILPGRLLRSRIASFRLMPLSMVCLARQRIWLSVTERVFRRLHRKFKRPACKRR